MGSSTTYKICSGCQESIRYDHDQCPFCGMITDKKSRKDLFSNFEWPQELEINTEEKRTKITEGNGSKKENPTRDRSTKKILDLTFKASPISAKDNNLNSKVETIDISIFKKLLLIVLSVFIPMLGSLVGSIIGVIYMNRERGKESSFAKTYTFISVAVFVVYSVLVPLYFEEVIRMFLSRM